MLNVHEIIERCQLAYMRCQSYVDRGTSIVGDADTRRTERFSTYFLRPRYYRFDCSERSASGDSPEHWRVWSDGDHHRVQLSRVEVVPSLSWALSSVIGAVGAAGMIASLLIAEHRRNFKSPLDVADLQFEGDSEIEGDPCYVISGQSFKPQDSKLWISKNTFIIRMIENDWYTTIGILRATS
jgi:hypothetical protein